MPQSRDAGRGARFHRRLTIPVAPPSDPVRVPLSFVWESPGRRAEMAARSAAKSSEPDASHTAGGKTGPSAKSGGICGPAAGVGPPTLTPMTPSNETPAGHRLFPGSRRVYLPGSRDDLRVPMREIGLSPTRLPNGTEVANEPVRVYDTSGPWGDPSFHADPGRGLPGARAAWIRERGDVEETPGRGVKPIDDGYLSERHRE